MANNSIIAVPTDFNDEITMRRFYSILVSEVNKQNKIVQEIKDLGELNTSSNIHEVISKLNSLISKF